MRWIRDWNIRTRLLLAFAGVLIPFLAIASLSMVGFRTLTESFSRVQEEAKLELKRTSNVISALDQLMANVKNYVVSNSPEGRKGVERHLTQFLAAMSVLATAHFHESDETRLLEEVQRQASRIEALSREMLSIPGPGADRAILLTMRELDRLGDQTNAQLRQLIDVHLSEIDKAAESAIYLGYQIQPIIFAVFLIGAVGAVGLSFILADWLSRPIRAIAQGSRYLADGDLSHRVEVSAGGELGEAASAFNAMAKWLEASAIEKARLYNAAAQRADRIAAINRLIKVINSSLDLGAVYDAFAKELKQLLPFTRMGIVVPDSSGKQFQVFLLAADQPGEAIVGRVWSNGKGTGIEWVMTHRQPHIEPDLVEARMFVEDEVILKEGIRSIVRLPLIVKGEVIGAIFLDDVEPGRYTESNLDLLVPLAEQMAIAVENARLRDGLEQKVEERTRTLQQAQAQLIQSGKLAAVGTMAAGVAHELNQPLMVIRGYTQELLADERLVDKEIREDLWRIAAQTTRMVAIINHLRDFSRQPKGKRQATDLNHVMTDALAFLGQQLKTKNIAVVQELLPALPPVWADPMQIEQVILNLVTNARDAMEEVGTGTITIRTELDAGSRVGLSVTDTGPGISGDIQARIFDPFFTTKEVGKGTGLGLSICHGIVEEHGGELTVESPVADGRGARFTIVLPRSPRDDSKGDRA